MGLYAFSESSKVLVDEYWIPDGLTEEEEEEEVKFSHTKSKNMVIAYANT